MMLANSLRDFRFCTLAGVENVRLADRKGIVIGRFRANLKEFCGLPNRSLIEDFLNWHSDLESILRFTAKYGPLEAEPVPSAEFRFSWFQDWVLKQRQFQSLWRRRSVFGLNEWERSSGSLEFQKGRLTYMAPNLYVFLYMDLVTSDPKRLRVCKREDCPHPYFIAGHLKQRFCSDLCAAWGQREWKKQWWKEHGESWRAQRRSKTVKGRKNVTNKTR
jgi:hypothetical protein